MGRPRLRLLRDRPAPLRPQHARVADAELRHRHPRVLRRRRRRLGPDHRPRRPRPRRRHRPLDGWPDPGAVGRRGSAASQGRGAERTVARPARLGLAAHGRHGGGRGLGGRQPMREIPREITTVYGESLHRDYAGEWDYDLGLKTLESWPVYAGWLRAIRNAHAEVHAGLDIACPVLVISSGATIDAREAQRRGARQRHRARRLPDPALVDLARPARHVRRRRRRHARHLPVARGACGPARTTSSAAGWTPTSRPRSRPQQDDQGGQPDRHDHPAQHGRREPAADGGADLAADHRADARAARPRPVDVGDERGRPGRRPG